MTYRIDTDRIQFMMRQSIASAVNAAVSRFERDLEADRNTAGRVAQLAAEMAIEQFASYCNCELAMIRADHEIRARMAELEPRSLRFLRTDAEV